ncbi:hypothetical protein OG266_38180 [Streptomyces sp. NBC_00554]|uniref:hypothetical protein n=1 Tax=Streptomyces sp. NBC_00554 TaxID=2903661 RepID=UPI00352CD702|nr:hypothetical protein OG266_38180 [Streptomyces sp. NBC_00554]
MFSAWNPDSMVRLSGWSVWSATIPVAVVITVRGAERLNGSGGSNVPSVSMATDPSSRRATRSPSVPLHWTGIKAVIAKPVPECQLKSLIRSAKKTSGLSSSIVV